MPTWLSPALTRACRSLPEEEETWGGGLSKNSSVAGAAIDRTVSRCPAGVASGWCRRHSEQGPWASCRLDKHMGPPHPKLAAESQSLDIGQTCSGDLRAERLFPKVSIQAVHPPPLQGHEVLNGICACWQQSATRHEAQPLPTPTCTLLLDRFDCRPEAEGERAWSFCGRPQPAPARAPSG